MGTSPAARRQVVELWEHRHMGAWGKGHAVRGGASRIALLALLALVLAGCGGGAEARWSEDPKGPALLPDFAPEPPEDIHTKHVGDNWTVEFSSALVNVGDGDFHATADKGLDGEWTMTQDFEHADGGASHAPSDAEPVWGGDGHEHWHVKRYVTYHLYARDEDGADAGDPRTDHKVGFCIYDFERSELDLGPDDAVYEREGCGSQDSTHLVMGLTPGWVDYYHWNLPGQSIPINGLADGDYRIYAVADEEGVFQEESTDNNRTWVDFTLSTDAAGMRTALVTEVGPSPE
jgi:hypothetical protein